MTIGGSPCILYHSKFSYLQCNKSELEILKMEKSFSYVQLKADQKLKFNRRKIMNDLTVPMPGCVLG